MMRRVLVSPVLASGLKERDRAKYVGVSEELRGLDGAVDVAFGSEVDYNIGVVLGENGGHGGLVGNIGLDEGVARVLCHGCEIRQTSCIGECIHVDDTQVWMGGQLM